MNMDKEEAEVRIPVKLTDANAKVPTRGTPQSNGYDLYTPYDIVIFPRQRTITDMEISFEIPDGYVGLLCPRSGHARKLGLTVLNSPGVIDSDYRGPLSAILINTSDEKIFLERGTKVMQILFVKTEEAEFEQVEELSSTERGANGFGSTGQ